MRADNEWEMRHESQLMIFERIYFWKNFLISTGKLWDRYLSERRKVYLEKHVFRSCACPEEGVSFWRFLTQERVPSVFQRGATQRKLL